MRWYRIKPASVDTSPNNCTAPTSDRRNPAPFPLAIHPAKWQHPSMKSFFLLLVTLLFLIAVLGGGGVLFYLAKTSEITRTTATPPASSPIPRN